MLNLEQTLAFLFRISFSPLKTHIFFQFFFLFRFGRSTIETISAAHARPDFLGQYGNVFGM